MRVFYITMEQTTTIDAKWRMDEMGVEVVAKTEDQAEVIARKHLGQGWARKANTAVHETSDFYHGKTIPKSVINPS